MNMDGWDSRRQRHFGRRGAPGLVAGAIIVVVGFLLLLQNLGLVRVHDLWEYWPVALVVVGLSRLSASRTPGALIFGSLLIAAGTLLLLDNLDILHFDVAMFWPVIVIGVGIGLLVRTLEGRGRWGEDAPPVVPAETDLHLYAIFGGSKRRMEMLDFRGGDALAVFGGVELDLRGSAIPSGTAVLDVSAVFGGMELTVPDNWIVDSRVLGLFAGVDDRSFGNRARLGTDAPRLIITGFALFAGVSVKN